MIVKIVPDRSKNPENGILYYECKFVSIGTNVIDGKIVNHIHMDRVEDTVQISPPTPCHVYIMECGKTVDSWWFDENQTVQK
jgi:hypothetical protein